MEKETPAELEREFSRQATQITLTRIDNYHELWAKTEQEGNDKFIRKTREVWKDFAVHGVFGVDKESGERIILNFTDLDGGCSLGLLKLAGIDTRNVKYINPGDHIEGAINLDTGNRYGLVIEDEGKTAFLDHHGEDSSNGTSATEIVYKTLTSLGMLKKERYLQNLVEFVTRVDNKSYPNEEEYFRDSWRTVLGLQRYIKFKHLLGFFKAGRKPTEILSQTDLKQFGLERKSQEQEKAVNLSIRELEAMEKGGLIIASGRYGRVAVDIGKKVPAGFDAAKAFGCDTYVIFTPEVNSFFISSRNPLVDSFPQGIKVRETMWIKPIQNKEPLLVTLGEILNQMTDGKLDPTGELKEFLDQERGAG